MRRRNCWCFLHVQIRMIETFFSDWIKQNRGPNGLHGSQAVSEELHCEVSKIWQSSGMRGFNILPPRLLPSCEFSAQFFGAM